MGELDHKEDFQIMGLEKTLESSLDCKEIKPVNPKGNQLWIFIGRTVAEAEAPIFWLTQAQRANSLKKQRMIWLDNQFNGHEFGQTAGDSDGQVPLYCGGSSLWVGLDGWLVKVSWLGKLALVFWWVELDFFSLECNEVSSNEFWDVSGFGVTLGSL